MAANPLPIGEGVQQYTLDTTQTYLVTPPDMRNGSSLRMQVKANGASPGSFVIKQCIRGTGYSGSDLISCVYGTTASTSAIAAGTAVSAGGVILDVISDGMETYLDYTASTHTVTVTVWKGNA